MKSLEGLQAGSLFTTSMGVIADVSIWPTDLKKCMRLATSACLVAKHNFHFCGDLWLQNRLCVSIRHRSYGSSMVGTVSVMGASTRCSFSCDIPWQGSNEAVLQHLVSIPVYIVWSSTSDEGHVTPMVLRVSIGLAPKHHRAWSGWQPAIILCRSQSPLRTPQKQAIYKITMCCSEHSKSASASTLPFLRTKGTANSLGDGMVMQNLSCRTSRNQVRARPDQTT